MKSFIRFRLLGIKSDCFIVFSYDNTDKTVFIPVKKASSGTPAHTRNQISRTHFRSNFPLLKMKNTK